ncbi:MAG TPA: glycosyltransferase family 39 protein [Anaerolineales bacterium]|nr:glycosyltransferase family 39 protein [Anaerolineales bacterium]
MGGARERTPVSKGGSAGEQIRQVYVFVIKMTSSQLSRGLEKNPPDMRTNTLSTSARNDRLFRIAIIAIIMFGMILRASKYLPGWLMRGDELAVMRNLINRSAMDLMTKPLHNEQAAPFGFVLSIKTLITIFGRSEYVLRLPAFLAGCFSLILMQSLLTKTGKRYGNIFALAGFAFGDYLIYYSAELKQYSTDVLLCLILLLAFYQHLDKETTAKDFIVLTALGTLALCFSYTALFIIAGIGITLLIHYWRNSQKLRWIALTGMIWMGTFLALYFLLLRQQTQDPYLITFWDNLLSFMPMPPWRDLSWFPKALDGLFFVVAGLSSSVVFVIPIYALGLWGFLKEKKWQWALVLTIPVGLNIVVSGFQKYPFHGRLILYLLPLIFIVLGKGIDLLIGLSYNRVFANAAFAALIILLLRPVIPTTNSYLLTHSYLNEELKSVFSFLEEHHQDDDLLYLYHSVGSKYIYYAPVFNLEKSPYIMGQNNSGNIKKYQTELAALPRGQRIWFVFSHVVQAKVRKGKSQDEREYILKYLKENGALLNEFYSVNNVSSAHLFILK